MIAVQEFLVKNSKDTGVYALVSYNGITEATWFTIYKYEVDKEPWFLESPCELHKICKVEKPIDEFCNEYVEECIELEDGESKEAYIEAYIKPMIVDGWFYMLNNFQTGPYLNTKVDNIEIISERECLDWMLKTTD